MATLEEMIETIGMIKNIDTRDWYGKYLALGAILSDMDKEEAEKVLNDMFTMMDDAVTNAYESALYDAVA